MKIYHNPRCTKSRETLQLLGDKGQQPEVIEYLKTPPSLAELEQILAMLGLEASQIVRKKESIYRELFDGKTPTNKQLLSAMVKHPILIERPIVVHKGRAVLGRPPENVLGLLK